MKNNLLFGIFVLLVGGVGTVTAEDFCKTAGDNYSHSCSNCSCKNNVIKCWNCKNDNHGKNQQPSVRLIKNYETVKNINGRLLGENYCSTVKDSYSRSCQHCSSCKDNRIECEDCDSAWSIGGDGSTSIDLNSHYEEVENSNGELKNKK